MHEDLRVLDEIVGDFIMYIVNNNESAIWQIGIAELGLLK